MSNAAVSSGWRAESPWRKRSSLPTSVSAPVRSACHAATRSALSASPVAIRCHATSPSAPAIRFSNPARCGAGSTGPAIWATSARMTRLSAARIGAVSSLARRGPATSTDTSAPTRTAALLGAAVPCLLRRSCRIGQTAPSVDRNLGYDWHAFRPPARHRRLVEHGRTVTKQPRRDDPADRGPAAGGTEVNLRPPTGTPAAS